MTPLDKNLINQVCEQMAQMDWKWGKGSGNFRKLARQFDKTVPQMAHIYYRYYPKHTPKTAQEARFTRAQIQVKDGELKIGEATITGNFEVVLR